MGGVGVRAIWYPPMRANVRNHARANMRTAVTLTEKKTTRTGAPCNGIIILWIRLITCNAYATLRESIKEDIKL